MSEKNLLEKNPNKIKAMLEGIVSESELQKIDQFTEKHVSGLLKLSRHHLNFSKKLSTNDWRQKVSRSYYACYHANRALRLKFKGSYSQDSSDHKKISDIPADFPDKEYWENFLSQFKGDRNTADYDHWTRTRNLNHAPNHYVCESEKFCNAVKNYLISRS